MTLYLQKQLTWVVSSAGLEHYLDRVGVDGSNPSQPTMYLVIWRFID